MPKVMTETPTAAADPLSDLLGSMHLVGTVLFRAEFREPWSVVTPDCHELARVLPVRTEHIIAVPRGRHGRLLARAARMRNGVAVRRRRRAAAPWRRPSAAWQGCRRFGACGPAAAAAAVARHPAGQSRWSGPEVPFEGPAERRLRLAAGPDSVPQAQDCTFSWRIGTTGDGTTGWTSSSSSNKAR